MPAFVNFDWKSIDDPETSGFHLFIKKSRIGNNTVYTVKSEGAYSTNFLLNFFEHKIPLIRKVRLFLREKRLLQPNYIKVPISPDAIPEFETVKNREEKQIAIITGLAKTLKSGEDAERIAETLKDPVSFLFSSELKSLDTIRRRKKDTFESWYYLQVDRQLIRKNPEEVLLSLYDKVKLEGCRKQLIVRFLGERGTEMGGLRRSFVDALFSSLLQSGPSRQMQFKRFDNGLSLPVANQSNKPAEWKVYLEMGSLLIFFSKLNCPIGLLFEEGMFHAITKFTESDLLKPLSKETIARDIQHFVEIYLCLMKDHADEAKAAADMLQAASLPDREFADIYYCDISEVPKERQAHMERLVDLLYSHLAPVQELAAGMRHSPFLEASDWEAFQRDPASFAVSSQGTTEREAIIGCMQFTSGVPEEQREWIRKWIKEADDKDIADFLRTVTGSGSLSYTSRDIHIEPSADAFNFSTCFHTAQVPFAKFKDYDSFKMIFTNTLGGEQRFNRL